jgi:hypothetical protein
LRYLEVGLGKRFPQLYRLLWPPQLPDQGHYPDWRSILCGEDRRTRDWFLRKTGRYMVELRRMSEAAGARFGVFLVHYLYIFNGEPFYEAQYPELKAKLDAWGCRESRGRPYREFMSRFLDQHGIWYRESYAAMLAEKQARPAVKLWNYYDYHYSPAGHRAMAREILDFVGEGLGAPDVHRP